MALVVLAAAAQAARDDLDLVSRATGAAGAKGNSDSFESAVSADGRFVSFTSGASNLHPDDTDPTGDVFVRDGDVRGPPGTRSPRAASARRPRRRGADRLQRQRVRPDREPPGRSHRHPPA
jgi:hypothetical protein